MKPVKRGVFVGLIIYMLTDIINKIALYMNGGSYMTWDFFSNTLLIPGLLSFAGALVMTALGNFLIFKNLPSKIEASIDSKMKEQFSNMELHFGKSGNLSNEHEALSKGHEDIKTTANYHEQEYFKPLLKDLVIKQAVNENTSNAISYLETVAATLQNRELEHVKEMDVLKQEFAAQVRITNASIKEFKDENISLKVKVIDLENNVKQKDDIIHRLKEQLSKYQVNNKDQDYDLGM
ncbi:hypothetical protein [Culicoidibacter larvae]|uniref:Uncharacterized protein n=1 Tax=Culicoidibacter larvae TaxID=2579976 RepID=A0A5R8Q7T2_9FIRM|nr:hypothetical protein [Culicoidibacter larvae]TLG71165.1 hypothetical protein FEZ08_11465 [Culicoidibacter larvae]